MPIKKIDKHKKNFGVKNSNAVKLQDMKTKDYVFHILCMKSCGICDKNCTF